MSDVPNQGSSDASWPEGQESSPSTPGGGTPPPPPPPGGGGSGGGTGGGGAGSGGAGNRKVDIGDALNYGWQKFQENLGPILIGLIGLFVVTAIAGLMWQLIVNAIFSVDSGTGFFVGLVASAIGGFVFGIGTYVIQAVMVRAGFDLVDGHGLETSRLFDTTKLGPILITGVLVSIGATIGYILCILPGIIFAVVAGFAIHFVVDQDKEPTDAIRSSIQLFRDNPGQALLLVIVTGIVSGAGALLCGVGLLVTVPVALIAQAYGFRQLNGQPVPNV